MQLDPEDKNNEFLVSLDFDEIIHLHDLVWWFDFLLYDQFKEEFFDAITEK